jgi:molybdate transport repressor ModE-like protein
VDADRLLSLELRHWAALKAIVAEGTFAAAARRLGYTQSAISQQIAALERITGMRLLERRPGRRPLGLTPAGAVMLRHGEAMLARAQAIQADLAATADGCGGSVRLGIYQSVGAHVLPELLRRFTASFPQVGVQLRESASDIELLDLVERGELDLTFCMLPVEDGPFASAELLADPYVLVVPSDSPLANGRRPAIREIAALPLIAFRSCRNDHRIEAQLRARGFVPSVVFRSDDNPTVQALVAAGVGAALMPRLTVDLDSHRTATVDVSDLFPPRLLGLVWHRDREQSDAARVLTDLARQVCVELQATADDAHVQKPRRTPTTRRRSSTPHATRSVRRGRRAR